MSSARLPSSSSRWVRLLVWMAVVAVGLSCGDGIFAPAAPRLGAGGLAVRYQVIPGEGGAAEAFDRAESARIRLFRPTDEEPAVAVLDTTLQLPEPGSERIVDLSVEMSNETEDFLVSIDLLLQGEALFSASSPVRLTLGSTAVVEPTLSPVVAGLEIAERFGPITTLSGTLQLSAAAFFASGEEIAGQQFAWESLDPEVVTVSAEGVATAQGEGEARVVASSGEFSGTTVVEVRAAEAAIEVEPEALALTVGSTAQMNVTVRDAEGNVLDRAPQFVSSDAALASVSTTGLVTARAEGDAVITVRSGAAPEVLVNVEVSPAPIASVAVTPATGEVLVGRTLALSATPRDASGNPLSGRTVTWASSNVARARVDANGVVTGVARGPVTITATSEGRSGTAAITVTTAAITLSAASAGFSADSNSVLPAAQNVSITNTGAGALTGLSASVAYGEGSGWLVASLSGASAPATLTLRPNTTDLAVGEYNAVVTIASSLPGVDPRTVAVTYTIGRAAVARVLVTPLTAQVQVGSTVQLTATAHDASGDVLTGRTITWSSSAPTVASVSSSGVVSGLAVSDGPVTITATSEGQSATAAVTVNAPAIALSASSAAFAAARFGTLPAAQTVSVSNTGVGDLSGLAATVAYEDGEDWLDVSLSGTTAPATLTVRPNTTELAAGVYAAELTVASSLPGVAARTVTVTYTVGQAAVASVAVSPPTAEVVVGSTVQLTATTRDAGGGVLTGRAIAWTSSAPTVASVSASGLVTGHAPSDGPVTITATSEGQSATAAVTVTAAAIGVSPPTLTFTTERNAPLPGPQNVSLTNTGAGELTGLSHTVAYTTGSGWLRTSLSGTSAPATLTVQPNTAALPEGDYAAVVTVASSLPGVEAQAIQVAYTVRPASVARVVVDPSSVLLTVGGTAQLTATVLDANGNPLSGRPLTWASSDSATAHVSQSGLVTGRRVSDGSVTITATSEGVSGSAAVDVVTAELLEEGFEGESGGWTFSGFWNVTNGAGIANHAFPTYVSLPPDDPSQGTLPSASEGAYYAWYGQPSTGNFMGVQSPTDTPLSGGRSSAVNSGTLTSPLFEIPESASGATLRFSSWFEIESMNPLFYDTMTVSVVADGQTFQLIKLNPLEAELGTADRPFTSTGFNTAPAFVPVAVSLDEFRGQSIRLVFHFATGDLNYNGFRGWIVDDIRVTDEPMQFEALQLFQARPTVRSTASERPPRPR